MSYTNYCDCKTPQCTLLQGQRPANGVWNVNKLYASQAIYTPNIYSKNGTINIQGTIFNENTPTFINGTTIGTSSSNITGLTLLTNTNQTIGTFTTIDLTQNQYPIFTNNTTNNTAYIGANNQFVAFTYLPKTIESGLSNNSTWEYWNGSAWTPLGIMASQTITPHNQYANTPFERLVNDTESVRLQNINPSWVKSTLNSIERYWIRIRLTNNITTIPQISSLNAYSSHTLIGTDGFIEKYGDAETETDKKLIFEAITTAHSPPDGSLTMSAGLQFTAFTATVKNFLNGVESSIGTLTTINPGTDTSKQLSLDLGFSANDNNSGDVLWEAEFVPATNGDAIDAGTLPSTTLQQTVSIPSNSSTKLTTTTINVSLNTILIGDTLGIRVTRRGDLAGDTYGNVITLINIVLRYSTWN